VAHFSTTPDTHFFAGVYPQSQSSVDARARWVRLPPCCCKQLKMFKFIFSGGFNKNHEPDLQVRLGD